MGHLSGAHSRPLFLSCSERFINDRRNERTKLVRSEVRIEPSSIISQEMLARLADTEERRSLLEGGGGYTEVFGPDGSTVAGPLDPSQEGLLFADLDMSLIAVAKMADDPTGHYSRPDVTRLLLNRQPRLAVQAFSPSQEPHG